MRDVDRENNLASLQVVFTPDLILNATSLASSDPGSGPVLLNVTVWNDGDCAAENVTLTASDGAAAANGTVCGRGVIAAISPGESSVLQLEANLSAGLHTVSVRAENGGPEIDCSNNLAQTTISVVRVPVANFTAAFTGTGRVQFTDRSTNTPTVWLWDFGDGTTSDAQHPLHTYATDGTYTVGLTVCNEFGFDETVRADAVVVTGVGGPVTAAGDADVYSGTVPLTVQFTDRSSGGPTAWCWSFGDGNISNEQHPAHVYTEEGNYSVSLIVRNATYEDICTLENQITVWTGLTATFEANVTSGVSPLTVAFRDLSTGGPESWLWAFGDNATSTEQHPTHTYTAAGAYTVNLTVTNADGSDTCEGYITVLDPMHVGLGNAKAENGAVTEAYLTISNATAIGAADLDLTYDPSVVTVDSVSSTANSNISTTRTASPASVSSIRLVGAVTCRSAPSCSTPPASRATPAC
jgi:PKD repeat protein